MIDVCLFLEGTYPYITGGVSTCVYQLIRETPNITYGLVYIGGTSDTHTEFKYPIPNNVKLIKEVYLFDYDLEGDVQDINVPLDAEDLAVFHRSVKEGMATGFEHLFKALFMNKDRNFDPFDLLQSRFAWNFLINFYEKQFDGKKPPSFIDYFYSWRFTHFPLFKIMSAEIPRAKVYHALCTGYAGLLGTVAKLRYGSPFFLTEHGIYSHEREIEIYQAEWIFNTDKDIQAKKNLSYFKEWWIKTFHFMSTVSYEFSDVISTLYNGNMLRQMKYGASSDKIKIIPNGIKISAFEDYKKQESTKQKVIALIGRVVPIKDIKTFIKSISTVKSRISDLRVLIIGPTNEDEDYYMDCKRMVSLLELGDIIEFTGKINIKDVLPEIDVLALSSISEGQPMVILEGYAASIPVVATDVGSCSELIYGMTEEDKNLGPSGKVVPFGMPDQLGNAIADVLENEEERLKMGAVGYERVSRYYREESTITNYSGVYNQFLSSRF